MKLDRTARPDRELLHHPLIITHGLPSSGKTSWADHLTDHHPEQFVKLERTEFHPDDYDPESQYHQGKKFQQRITRAQMDAALAHIADGKTVIISDTNLDHRTMRVMVEQAAKHNVSIGQKYFDVPVEECVRRNAQRPVHEQHDPEHIRALAAEHYGRDGRIQEYTLSPAGVTLYDRAGSAGETLIAEYMQEQHTRYPVHQQKLANFDMDGTLVDTRALADQYMQEESKDFHAFHTLSEHAPPNPAVVADAWKAHEAGYTISVTTARSDEYAAETIQWLRNNNMPVAILKHRRAGDYRSDYHVKSDMIEELRYEGYDIVHSWDDNPQAIRAFTDAGIRVTPIPHHQIADTPQEYTTQVEYASAFQPGVCLRCGRRFQGEGTLGPSCRRK